MCKNDKATSKFKLAHILHVSCMFCFIILTTNKVLEKTLESLLDCKEIQPVHSKGYQSWLFIGRTDIKAETLILWPPEMQRADSFEKTLMLGKIEGRRRG